MLTLSSTVLNLKTTKTIYHTKIIISTRKYFNTENSETFITFPNTNAGRQHEEGASFDDEDRMMGICSLNAHLMDTVWEQKDEEDVLFDDADRMMEIC
mmetsp:Transcript_1979/g.2063  ORF Transcript_1979/g.2063 Transcript_1979/m.2063 type:complete len:98 (+) Transcript_1979:145-438(+)